MWILTFDELSSAVFEMPKDKAPGLDGLTVEVYQEFWPTIGHILFEAYQQVCKDDKMFPEAMTGVLNLLPKGQKDPRYLKNLRPITLLNVDYKVIEKVIASRLQKVLPSIIHVDQAGFMKKRKAAVNVRKLIDSLQYCENKEIDALILCLDYMKAFDRVELTSIMGSLKFFGFPELICKWVKILYTDFKIRIQNNGYLSEDILISRSVHQGGCASAFLYIILAEVMAIYVRQNPNICGVRTGDHEQKLNLFADDTSVTSLFNQQSLDAIFDILEWFQKQSGLRKSYEKTFLYRIGSVRNSAARLITKEQISWEDDGINVLGIYITHKDDILPRNYDPILKKASCVLSQWKSRSLSLIGKITVINTLVASLCIHKMLVLPSVQDGFVRKMTALFTDFIWNGARPKIAARVLMLNKNQGGLGLVNLQARDKALKCTWIQSLNQDQKCAELAFNLHRF